MNIKELPCMGIVELSYEEMLEIYDSINFWNWHSLLGTKPKWWADSKNDRKYKYTENVMETIEMITSEKDRLMYHHINNLDRTRAQFYHWWYIERHIPNWLGFWIFKIKNRE